MIEMTAPQSPPAATNRSSPNTSRTRRVHRPPVCLRAAARTHRGREPVPGNRRHDDVEGVGRITAVGRGVRQRTDHLAVVPEAPRPPVREHDRERVGPLPRHVDVVDDLTVDLHPVVGKGVDLGLDRAPVVVVEPPLHELLEVRAVDAEAPGLVVGVVGPADPPQPVVEVVEHGLVDRELERLGRQLGAHVSSSSALSRRILPHAGGVELVEVAGVVGRLLGALGVWPVGPEQHAIGADQVDERGDVLLGERRHPDVLLEDVRRQLGAPSRRTP